MAILATIHQPSSELLFQFDRVILLSEGFTIYNGSPLEVQSFFGQFGFKMPKYANPADKLSTIASEPWKELNRGVTIVEIADLVRVKQIKSFELETQEENELNEDLVSQFTTVAA